jgi:hypothetical protein
MEMKSAGKNSNLLYSGKINDQQKCEDDETEDKFSKIELQSKSKMMVNSLPLHPINYELNQI